MCTRYDNEPRGGEGLILAQHQRFNSQLAHSKQQQHRTNKLGGDIKIPYLLTAILRQLDQNETTITAVYTQERVKKIYWPYIAVPVVLKS